MSPIEQLKRLSWSLGLACSQQRDERSLTMASLPFVSAPYVGRTAGCGVWYTHTYSSSFTLVIPGRGHPRYTSAWRPWVAQPHTLTKSTPDAQRNTIMKFGPSRSSKGSFVYIACRIRNIFVVQFHAFTSQFLACVESSQSCVGAMLGSAA